MARDPRRLLVAALAAFTLLTGGPAAAQETEETTSGDAFFDTVDVNVVNVEVVVTDRAGNPLSDLTREDFEVLEDGRQVAITNFYKVVDGEIPPDAAPVVGGEPAVPGAEPEAALPDSQRLYLIVYIDNFNLRPFNRNRTFRRVREFLRDNVGREDKVMLVTYDRSFKERVPFTNDPTVVNSALFEIERESAHGVHDDSERRDVLRAIDDAESPSEALMRVRQYAGSKHNDLMFTIDAMKELVDKLGGLEGRKALLYVSDGLPMVPGEDLFYAVNQRFQEGSFLLESRNYDLSRRFQELGAQANANRVTFYTIDAAGLRPLTSASAETAYAGVGVFIDQQYIHNIQAPLMQLASDTGGRAIINNNDVGEALGEVGRELRTYYSLGYQPAHHGDGRYHKVDVRVKRKGVRVRHRVGYRDKTVTQRMQDGTSAALLFGEVSNPLGLRLGFGEKRRRAEGHFLTHVRVAIPLRDVVTVPMAGNHEARLKIFVSAMDDEGHMSPVQEVALPLHIPEAEIEQARTMEWGYDMTLLMRRGWHKVAVGVRDELSGSTSFVIDQVFVEE